MSEKTEEATPKRRRKAQEDGDSGASAFASQALAFLIAVAVVPPAVRATATWAAGALRDTMSSVGATRSAQDLAVASLDPSAWGWRVIALAAPALLAAGVTGGAASLVQAGGVVATKRLTPKLERLDVIAGFKNVFSRARLFSVARSMMAAGVVSWLAWRVLRAHAVDLARLAPLGAASAIAFAGGELGGRMARDAALVGLALAAIDLVVVRRSWRERLRMTKEEVKREHKESEGDPLQKAARERAHHEMLASATIANVRHASVVVVNPTHIACALRYDEEEGDDAPVIVASGEGDLARRIVRAAHDYGVPVVQDIPLARALRELEVGDTIPEALYEAVAEILRAAWEADL